MGIRTIRTMDHTAQISGPYGSDYRTIRPRFADHTRRVCEYFVDGWHFTNREQQKPRAREIAGSIPCCTAPSNSSFARDVKPRCSVLGAIHRALKDPGSPLERGVSCILYYPP
ncbi:hypothetical protein DPMN_075062 [Dreissena polymorpha]|uniref:Uncharacterized protein n=1 Tax=Dreissena polymorpha TaxID=45954 RepID=A0A9D3YGD3_DREPO|nr:hypothetical protein DPMN_075062 [Dreissena polymorpha]